MATFSLILTQSPFSGASHILAQDFARTLLTQGHRLQRVFFYQDAVLAGLSTQNPPQGQTAVCQQWQALAAGHGFPLQVCIANALRRGVSDSTEQQRYNLPATTLAAGFELAGLGEMAEAALDSDRIIDF
ncbi:MAG: sulfurtransferase complex subunit TusD [Saccharospirillaceae bacterium]|nr:sulfurtransferase complex subunit TusD [Saccharospirillaceae bacterium]MCD8531697.1 sulfurtransferase complex subunit TusD [Saccharospirillaceae bacterium]